MHYIYCYTNLINGKTYVGQTCDVQKRKREHLASAKCSSRKDYNDLFHKKIREYGIENFSFEILEEISSEDYNYIDAREIYWIQVKNSYVKNNKGYNLTLGGQHGARRKPTLSEEQVFSIKGMLLNTNIQQYKIAEQFNTTTSLICKINTGKQYYDSNLNYPLRKNFIDEETKKLIRDFLIKGDLSSQKIADNFGVSLSTVKRIKASLKIPQKPVSTIAG